MKAPERLTQAAPTPHAETPTMKFMLMMNTPSAKGGAGDYQVNDWSPEDFKAHIDFMHRFNARLKEDGHFVGAEGLAPPKDARLVRATRDGAPVTDGPFAETKEFLAGYWIIDVESAEEAYAVAARASAAPGPGGAPMNMPIEVRQVMSAPKADL